SGKYNFIFYQSILSHTFEFWHSEFADGCFAVNQSKSKSFNPRSHQCIFIVFIGTTQFYIGYFIWMFNYWDCLVEIGTQKTFTYRFDLGRNFGKFIWDTIYNFIKIKIRLKKRI